MDVPSLKEIESTENNTFNNSKSEQLLDPKVNQQEPHIQNFKPPQVHHPNETNFQSHSEVYNSHNQTYQPPVPTFQHPPQTYQHQIHNYPPNTHPYPPQAHITQPTHIHPHPYPIGAQHTSTNNVIVVQPSATPIIINQNTNSADYPELPVGLALAVLVLNIFLPGIGTMVMGCNSGAYAGSWVCIGICQMFLSLLFIGWVWGIITGIICLSRARNNNQMYINTI
jgi:hypothetical protein